MKPVIKIFNTPLELAESLAVDLVIKIKEAEMRNSLITMALSGGSTPSFYFLFLVIILRNL